MDEVISSSKAEHKNNKNRPTKNNPKRNLYGKPSEMIKHFVKTKKFAKLIKKNP